MIYLVKGTILMVHSTMNRSTIHSTRPTGSSEQRKKELLESANAWLTAVDNWQLGNKEFKARRYASAVSAYTPANRTGADLFLSSSTPMSILSICPTCLLTEEPSHSMNALIASIFTLARHEHTVGSAVAIVTAAALHTVAAGAGQFRLGCHFSECHHVAGGQPEWGKKIPLELGTKTLRQRSLDRPLLILATVMVPLARAEANRMRRQYDAAEKDLRRVLTPYTIQDGGTPPTTREIWLNCDFIERPIRQAASGRNTP